MSISDHTQSKISKITSRFPKFAPAHKKSVHSIDSFLKYQSIFESCDQTCHTNFWPCQRKKKSDQLLVYVNLYQHAKNLVISQICSRDMVDWKILQSDWLTTFWPISQVSRKIFSPNMGFVQENRRLYKFSLL